MDTNVEAGLCWSGGRSLCRLSRTLLLRASATDRVALTLARLPSSQITNTQFVQNFVAAIGNGGDGNAVSGTVYNPAGNGSFVASENGARVSASVSGS